MIPNLINVLVGLGLVYASVLKPSLVQNAPINLLVESIVIVGCATWARSGDCMGWFSLTNIVIGSMAALLAGIQLTVTAPDLVTFWGVFWIGLTIAVVALWAALYPQPSGESLRQKQIRGRS